MNEFKFALQVVAAVGSIRQMRRKGTPIDAESLKPIIDPLVVAWDKAFPDEAVDPELADIVLGIVGDYTAH